MTTKREVDLDSYQKSARLLAESMETALGPGGGLHSLLLAVNRDARLRVDIRHRRFNVYYRGGSLLLVDGRKSPPILRFDRKYFRNEEHKLPSLPPQFEKPDDIRAWIDAFPDLMKGMDGWWNRKSAQKGAHDHERDHCQAMATANSARTSSPSTEYLVLDLEYQWAQRRFDMVAAKRRPTDADQTGWVEPDFVFVEVKSEYGACCGTSGIGAHIQDYQEIIGARDGLCVQSIKDEYQNLVTQKRCLRLLTSSLPFKQFSVRVPELLIVLVDLDPTDLRVCANTPDAGGGIRCMCLCAPDYAMTEDKFVTVPKPSSSC